ncbi:MAG: GNAT family N-acetyltransferase [Acidobacteriota bacterium]
MTDPPELETRLEPVSERLQLRSWRDADRAPFAALNADPVVMEHYPAPLTRAESDALLDRWQAQIEARGWGFWAVEHKDTGTLIGGVGLSIPRPPFPFLPCVEVGWRLARQHWGHGYATEAARVALDAGFGPIGLDEIVSFTAASNLRSRAVMERLGMRYDRDFEHPALAIGHPLRRHCLYRLVPSRGLG